MADGDVAPASSDNDKWHDAITLLTGFTPPMRGTVFKDLYGNDDIPLMKVEIHNSTATPSNAELDAINDLSWRTQNSGWRIENTDFVVPFYSGMNGAVGALPVGSEVQMRKARITLLGTNAGSTAPPAGGVDMGGQFGDHSGSHLMPDGFKGWDSTMLANYSYGGGLALEQLLNPPYTTHGWGMNGKNVADGDSVDVNTFELAAEAFDRAALFFSMSRQTIQNWEDQLGSEDAAWRGQAAGVFWDMIHQLGINYQNYSDALPLTLFQSKAGYDLRTAKQGFVNAITNLHSTWSTWALYTGNPLRWLHDILLEVTDDIWYNNITKVRYKYDYSEYDTGHQEVEYDGFRANVASYGNLDDIGTWKAIGEEAIKRWQKSVQDTLEVAGKQALIDVNNTFVDVPEDLHVLTTTQVNLLSDYQADKAAAEQAKADQQHAEDLAAAAAAQAKADQQRAEDLAAAAAAQAKADQQRADDLAHQHEMEAEQKKQRAEDLAAAAAAQAKADQQRAEDLAHQQQQEEEQKKQYEQQQQEQKQQQEEQKQQQQQQQEEQNKQQQQQQDEQKRQYEEQMAAQAVYQQKQEKQQEEQQAKQDQQQQHQDQLQQQQEAEQKAQYEQQRQDQKQQQEEQKQQQLHQEALAQQQYAQQQQTQADYQKKQEDAQQKQQQQQQDLQKKQEAQQQQQQDLQQKQYEQQRQDQQNQQQQYAQQLGQYSPQGNSQLQSLQQQHDQLQQQLENGAGQIGSQTHLNPDGTVTTDYTDGSSTTVNPHTGLETTTHADGTVTTDHLSGGQQLTNPDGSHTTVNQDGTVTTRYPDGSVTTVNPNTGTAVTHEPDGKTVTTPLGGGATLPHSSYANLGSGTQYPSSYQHELFDSTPYQTGSLGAPGYSGVAANTPGLGISQSGGVLPLGTRIDGTTTGGGLPAGGAPMGGGGMPMMGGMGGMGGGGGGAKDGSGERVREVYEDEDVVTNGGSLGRRGGAGRRGLAGEEAATSGRRTSTSSAYDPFMGGEDHEQTQSGDRERDAWVPEEEDVWGTDEGGAPAVIGG
jgi:hypothetical protein